MMINKLLDFERSPSRLIKDNEPFDDFHIEEKYIKGYSRVVTENGSYKIGLIRDTFTQKNYNLKPDYQRRITWSTQKRSKLIESLIMNIPIPPIFLYEYEYDKYEVMDGLQRISSIIDFYNDVYALTGLEEWKEVNGKTYSELPEKIREGIDRRQIQVITLLKESATNNERADKIKRLVFERLNTGGVMLRGQEIRNAIYNGAGNQMCIKLSENNVFRSVWDIPFNSDDKLEDDAIGYEAQLIQSNDDEKSHQELERHTLYKRMYDVELVLRFFAMRHVNDLTYKLADFLDDTLINLNMYTSEQLSSLEEVFVSTINKAFDLFGTNAFKMFNGTKWGRPTNTIYDPLMIVLSQVDLNIDKTKTNENIDKLKEFYIENLTQINNVFDGKRQSRDEILVRVAKFESFLRKL